MATSLLGALESAAARVGEIDGRFLVIALALQLMQLLLRAGAWRNTLAAAYADRPVPRVGLAAAYVAGGAINVVVPAKAGEAAKLALARAQIGGSAVGTIASASVVVLVFDALVAVALLGVAWSLGLAPALPAPAAVGTAAAEHALPALALSLIAVCLVVVLAAALRSRVRDFGRQIARGAAVLQSPRRWVRDVASLQLAAWGCRVAVTFFLLAAFGLEPTLGVAVLVVLFGGMSTFVPTPGGVGAHQALLVVALHESASAATAISFSVGMQVTIALVNTAVGLAALMLLFGTLRPGDAARAGLRLARREG